MSSFETAPFVELYQNHAPTASVDALLLHTGMNAQLISKETALSLIHSPLAPLGLLPLLLGFPQRLEFTEEQPLSPSDSHEALAVKPPLLSQRFSSIFDSPPLRFSHFPRR
jgi:hypothetical protein